MRPKFYVTYGDVYYRDSTSFLDTLKEMDIDLNFYLEASPPPQEEINSMFRNCDICICCGSKVTAEMMDSAPNLRLIAVYGSGFDNVDISAAKERGIYVTNARGGNATAVAELTVTTMLSLARSLVLSCNEIKSGVWMPRIGSELFGKTYGILGCGAIGAEVARIVSLGFNMKVLACDPYPRADVTEKYGVSYVSAEELFRQSDFLSVHAPLQDSTYDCVDYSLLSLMKPSAYIVNSARGGIVNETDLMRALDEHLIAGAGLDVFVQEPYRPEGSESPFIKYDDSRFLATPHMAACSREAVQRISRIVLENVDDALNGRRPRHNIVNGL